MLVQFRFKSWDLNISQSTVTVVTTSFNPQQDGQLQMKVFSEMLPVAAVQCCTKAIIQSIAHVQNVWIPAATLPFPSFSLCIQSLVSSYCVA